MYSSKTHDKGQKLVDRGNTVLSHDAAKLLKTQDAGYLKTVAQQTRRAREKLEKEYMLKHGERAKVIGQKLEAGKGQHIFFAGTIEEQQRIGTNSTTNQTHDGSSESHISDDEFKDNEDIESDNFRLPVAQTQSRKVLDDEAAAQKQATVSRRRRKRRYEAQSLRLKALRSREWDVMAAERELDLQRAKMSNSFGGKNKAGVKFKVRERKR